MSELPKNTRVLVAIPVLFVGGTEIHTLNLVKALVSGGYLVSICCYYDYDRSMVSKFEETGAEIILMGLRWPGGLLSLFIKLINLFKKVRPGIVHVQYVAPGLIPIMAAKLAGVKRVFATVHQPGRIYKWKHKMFIRVAAHLCDAFFCNSRSVEESWFGDSEVFYPMNIDSRRKHFTIYNGVDIERIETIGKEVDREKLKDTLGIRDKRVIGVVGRLRKEKGQATLLESMKTVIEELPDTVLLVAGDGPDRRYLEEMGKKLSIDSHVKWLGQKDCDEMLRLYNIMDVVVIPSLFEGFGLTAAEAMATGKAVVASNVDGLSEIVQDGVSGLLVAPGSCKPLAHAVLALLTNPAKAALMGNLGRKVVGEFFSLVRFRSYILSAFNHFA